MEDAGSSHTYIALGLRYEFTQGEAALVMIGRWIAIFARLRWF